MSYLQQVDGYPGLAGFSGFGCGPSCSCGPCRAGRSRLSGFGETGSTVRELRVVVKSFINCIGRNLGLLPARCSPLSYPNLLAFALATDRMMCENPMHDRKDKGYRLFSACTFRITCENGRVAAVTPSVLDTDTGKEGPLQAPPLVATPVAVTRTADGFDFTWFGRGRPNLGAEPAMQLVCPRTSVFIWHRISGSVRCPADGTSVTINLTGSKFPTHRAYVNGTPVRTMPQNGLARLWFPVSLADPLRVDGFAA